MRVFGHSSVLVSVCAALALAACGDDGGAKPTGSPDTVLDTQPAAQTNQRHFQFAFHGTPADGSSANAVLTFTCSLDAAAPSECTSPQDVDVSDGDHTFSVTAIQEGNTDPSPATASWHVDSTPPDTTITSGPPSFDNATSATIMFTGTPATDVAKFECAFDTDTFTDCTNPATIDNLTSATHTFKVRAVDALGNADPTPAQHSWTTDTSTPDTMITGGPASASVTNGSVMFTFTSTLANAAFECSFDNGSYTSCTSPIAYNSLAGGAHTFAVRAKNTTTNVVDPTPATRMWMVDATPPTVSIDMKPTDPTMSTTPMFTFSSTDTDVAGYECQIDGVAAFAACTSPFTGPALAEGLQTFRVRATDNVGNQSTTTYSWTIDVTPPVVTITSGPSGPTGNASPVFTFNTAGNPVSVQCQLDTGAFADCTSPKAYTALPDGAHTFTINATDAAGNVGTASRSFTLTTSGPVVTITGGPTGPTNDNTPTFTFTVTGAVSIDCRFDGAINYAPCTSPYTAGALADGPHIFEVRGTDSAGNPRSATRSFTVDTAAPTVTITSGPNGPTNMATPTFAFVTSGSPSKIECRYDANAFAACTSPFVTTVALTQGAHEFDVRVTDDAGNIGSDLRNITVQTMGPGVAITSGPNGATNNNKPSWNFTTSGSPTSVQCKIDATAFADCTSPYAITTALADGTHTFTVQVSDAAGNLNSDSRTIMVDTAAPTVTITSGPSGPTNQQTPAFAFSVSGSPTSTTCKIDTALPTACTSPYTSPTVLAEGAHSFTVQVGDDAGNTSSAVRNFTVDITPPTVTITNPTPDQNNNKPTFTWTSSGNTSTQCKMDMGAYTPCTSGFTSPALGGGSHTFTVQVADDAGNTATASQTFTINSTAPSVTIAAGPNGGCGTPNNCDPTNDNTPTFSFNVGAGWSTVQCDFDSGSTVDCSQGLSAGAAGVGTFTASTALSSGSHTFDVTACNASGNCASDTKAFTVDITAPTIVITSGPSGKCPAGSGGATCDPSSTNTPTFVYASAGGAVKYECASIAGTGPATAFADCGSTTTFTTGALGADGQYTFTVRVTDSAFNQRTASVTFRVDTAAPTVAFNATPPAENNGTNNPTPTFMYTVTDPLVAGQNDLTFGPGATYTCTVDGNAGSCNATTYTTASLTENEHTVVVQARDIAGNAASNSYTFIEDRTAPTVTIGDPSSHGSLVSHTRVANPTLQVSVADTKPGGTTKTTQLASVTCNFVPQVPTGATVPCVSHTTAEYLAGVGIQPMTNLATGTWQLQVNATDGAGNTRGNEVYALTVDLVSPSYTTAATISPTSPNKNQPTLSFSVTDNFPPLDMVQCSYTNTSTSTESGRVACSGTAPNYTYSPTLPSDGSYTLNAYATDTAGNVTPTSVAFFLDRVAPNIVIAATGPTDAAPTTNQMPQFTVTVTDPAPAGTGAITKSCVFTSRTGGGTKACTYSSGTPDLAFPTANLPDDQWTLTVNATDAAGNASTPATRDFIVDIVNPVLTITRPPTPLEGVYTNTVPTLTFTATDNHLLDAATVLCTDNGAAQASCSGGTYAHAGIADGTHEGAHAYVANAKDKAGNSATPITFNFVIDTIAPTIAGGAMGTISGGNTYASGSGTVSFTVMDANAAAGLTIACGQDLGGADPTGSCALMGGEYVYTLSPAVTGDGPHTVTLKATDKAGNSNKLTVTFRLDTTPPTTAITSPANNSFTNSSSASVAFTATDVTTPAGVTTTCSVDGGSYASCTSPLTVTGEGAHTVKVKGTDSVGNTTADASAASVTFTIDTTAPMVAITSPTANQTFTTAAQMATFTASDANAVSTGPQCKLNATGSFADCTSPYAMTLTEGSNTLFVKLVDKAGNTGMDSKTFILDSTPPTISSVTLTPKNAATNVVTSLTPTITIAATDANPMNAAITYTCALDGSTTFNPCTSGGMLTYATQGAHMVTVKATDSAGNTTPTGTTVSFTINTDTTPPTITVTSGTHTCTAGGSMTIPPGASITVQLADSESGVNDAQSSCAYNSTACGGISNHMFTFTAVNANMNTSNVVINAKDLAGNDAPTFSCAVTTDNTATPIVVKSGPRGPTNDPHVAYAFELSSGALDQKATAQCSYDGGAFGACTTDKTFVIDAPVAQKVHTFAVRAVVGDKVLGSDKASFELDPIAMCLDGNKQSGVADLSTLLEKQTASSIELWFKSHTDATSFDLFAVGTGATARIDAGNLVVALGTGKKALVVPFALPQKLDLTQWHHYAVSLTAGSLVVFVDGVALTTASALPAKLPTLAALVGTADVAATLAGPGAYLDLRIAGVARATGFAPTFPAMVDKQTTALYPLGEAKGTSSQDLVDDAPDLEWSAPVTAWSTCAK